MSYKVRKQPRRGRSNRKPRQTPTLPEFLAACKALGVEPGSLIGERKVQQQGGYAMFRLAIWITNRLASRAGKSSREIADGIGTYHLKVRRALEGLITEAGITDEPDAYNIVWASWQALDGEAFRAPAPSEIARAMKQVGIVE